MLVRLVQQVGNFLTNFPPNGFLAHDRLAQGRPDLVTARVMGWPDGKTALDYTINPMIGYADQTGPGPDPANHVLPAWDLLAGAYAAFSLMAGINRRAQTGVGGEIRIPLSDIAIGTAANLGGIAEVLYEGHSRGRMGNTIHGLFGRDFITADGVRVMLAAVTPKQWSSLVAALKLEAAVARVEAARQTSFATDDGERFRNGDALNPLFAGEIALMQFDDLCEILDKAGCMHGRYNSMFQAAQDPKLVTNNPLFSHTTDNASGFAYPAAGSLATIPAMERGGPVAAPRNGQHSEEVLTQFLGMDATEFAQLVDQRIVGTA